jgi:predicted flap endonuclease-1-like 5' DNA nuclease
MLFSTPSHFVVLALIAFGFWMVGLASRSGGRKWREMYEQEAEDFSVYRTDADDKIRAANRRIGELEHDNAALDRAHAESAATIAALEARLKTPEPAAPTVVPEPAPPEPVPVEPVAVAPVLPQPLYVPAAAEPVAATPLPEPAEPEPVAEVPLEPVEPVTEALSEPVAPEPVAEALPEPVAEVVEAPATEGPLPITAPTPTPAFAPAVPEKAWFGAAGYNDLTQVRGIDTVLSTRLFGLGVTRFADIEKLSAEDEIALEQRLNVPAGFIAREQWRDQAALLRAGNTAEHQTRFGVTANA